MHCGNEIETVQSTNNYIQPQYILNLRPINDTMYIHVEENVDSLSQKINIFYQNNTPFLSLIEPFSGALSIYNISSNHLVKKLSFKELLKYKRLVNLSVYVKNFDSLFVANQLNLYLFDSSGAIQFSVDLQKDHYPAWISLGNEAPPILKNNLIYAKAFCALNVKSFEELKEWRSLYGISGGSSKAQLYYPLPTIYQTNLYGSYFFDYNYCYNQKSNFVFSFPADTNIYETNLADYHIAYCGKSQSQKNDISALSQEDLSQKSKNKGYLLRGSYGPIFFDPYKKRYLRVFKSKISEQEFQLGKREKRQGVIILDEGFKIIGESFIDNNVLLKTIFFTPEGKIYARIKTTEKHSLTFIGLSYDNNMEEIENNSSTVH